MRALIYVCIILLVSILLSDTVESFETATQCVRERPEGHVSDEELQEILEKRQKESDIAYAADCEKKKIPKQQCTRGPTYEGVGRVLHGNGPDRTPPPLPLSLVKCPAIRPKPKHPYTERPRLKYAPRYFVGSYNRLANKDMAVKPTEWETVRAKAGMFVHPMGFYEMKNASAERTPGKVLKRGLACTSKCNRVKELFDNYKTKWFTCVQNIMDHADLDRSIFRTYDEVKDYDKETKKTDPNKYMRCAGIYVYIADLMFFGHTEKTAEMFKNFVAPAVKIGIPIYFFFTPINVSDTRLLRFLRKPIQGMPAWIWFAKYVGASGISLDYPIDHYVLGMQLIKNDIKKNRSQLGGAHGEYMRMAHVIAKTTQAAGLKLVWCLNNCQSLQDVTDMATHLRDVAGVRPDQWLIDHFSNGKFPGTPETAPSVTGIAKQLIDGKF